MTNYFRNTETNVVFPSSKTFNGIIYNYDIVSTNKKRIDQHKKICQDSGYFVRVIKIKNLYILYIFDKYALIKNRKR